MSHRLLVIDDEPGILLAVAAYFRHLGYEVDCASEREEAEALLSQISYSCVIADLRLTPFNGADGLEIVASVRAQFPSTRIIVLSACGSPAMEQEARRRGADAFFHKPRPLADVARAVSSLIEIESVRALGAEQ